MKKSLCLLVLALALSPVHALLQTTGPGGNPALRQKPANPATTPAQTSTPASQPAPTQTLPTASTPQTQSETAEPQGPLQENAPAGPELQTQIQHALQNEPTLSKDHVSVSVSEDQIDVSGTVATAKEKLTAKRIVQSYAGNRKVKDQLAVRGHNPENAATSAGSTQNPASNPDQSKNRPQPRPQPPQ